MCQVCDIMFSLVSWGRLEYNLYNKVFNFYVRFVVPMQNGELDARGLLAALVQSAGTLESFEV